MILNCAIIDEDPEALQLLEQYIEPQIRNL